MKKERIIEIIILLILFSSALIGGLTYKHYKIEKPNTYNIIFKDIDSIVKGSPVRFMGMNVGHVVRLKRKDKYIICRIKITKKDVKIPNGTVAKVAFNGLGGSKSVELMPPLEDKTEIKGIVAGESLRINDFVSVVRDLKDVCIIINNFVQEIDPIMLMNGFKEFTNPEIINRVDSDMQRIIDTHDKNQTTIQNFIEKEGIFSGLLDWAEENFNKMFSKEE